MSVMDYGIVKNFLMGIDVIFSKWQPSNGGTISIIE